MSSTLMAIKTGTYMWLHRIAVYDMYAYILNMTASEASTAEQKRTLERKRNIMVLIMQHLLDNGI